MAAPLVNAIGANNITGTSATIIGSINPQGLSGTWWFAAGLTSGLGTNSPTGTLAASSTPQTVTYEMTGLTAGTTYYYAVACSTSGGTVTSAPLSFTAADPSQATTPVGVPSVSIPHWQYPVRFNGGMGVVEQDTLEEVFSNVQTIVACSQGACPELPDFGVPDLFGQLAPIDPQRFVNAIQNLEPRASESAIAQTASPDSGEWRLSLTTQYAQQGG